MNSTKNTDKWVTTRKEHKCDQCNRKFPKGSTMYSSTFLNVDGGGWVTWHICEVCKEVLDICECRDYDGILYEMAAYNNDPDFWEETRKSMEGETT